MSRDVFDSQEAEVFSDAVAIVAGGTSGVGRATARRLAEAGIRRAVIVGRNAERGAETVRELADRGAEAVFLAADPNDPDEAHRIVDEAVRRFGGVDILVNCLNGTARPTLLVRMATEDMGRGVLSQLAPVMHMTHAAYPVMKQRGSGAIVNVASDAGKSPTPGEAVVGAAMAGVIMFSRTAAMELKRDGIRVNVVTPSLITGTGGYQRVQDDEFSTKLFSKAIPLAQLGLVDAEDMAELIVFLCSPRSGKLTGQAVSLNGGISAH
jgi:2-hydroxycyclohexanecarboxyl-CoA dehydrogenase